MPEKHLLKLPPRHKFIARFIRSIVIGLFLIFVALFIGMLGYHFLEHMSWTDAFVNAAMILSGMGPMGTLTTTQGKIFAGIYAMLSGLFFIAAVGLIFLPLAHRLFKKWHLEDESNL